MIEELLAGAGCAAAAAVGQGPDVTLEAFAGGAGPHTRWDLASLTKVLATVPAVLRLEIALGDRLDAHVPELRGAAAGAASVEQLLAHTAGLPAAVGAGEIAQTAAVSAPGTEVRYSDAGYVALGLLVQAAADEPLAAAFERHVSAPLALRETAFGGPVHDPTARRLGGLAGHAGMFASLIDVSALARAWLEDDAWIPAERRDAALQPHTDPLPGGRRGLGWCLHPDEFHCAPGGWVSHTGYTGTSIALDPATRRWAVLLTDLLPDGDDATRIVALRRQFHALAAAVGWIA